MKKTSIRTEKAPKAIGPYSQGVSAGNMIFTSGQIPLDPITGSMASGDISVQTERAIQNVEEVLKAAGSSLNDVVKVTIFLKDMGNFSKVNSVYEKYFSDNKPARACVGVASLPKDAEIEIEAVAIKD